MSVCGRCNGTGQAPMVRGNLTVSGETMPCPACLHREFLRSLPSRNPKLDCPECETPAVSASSVIDGRQVWTEADDETWCPGCGCLLHVSLTTDCQGSQWYEARVSEYSGRVWRRAIERALGVDDVPDEHTPDQLADVVLKQREIGNHDS